MNARFEKIEECTLRVQINLSKLLGAAMIQPNLQPVVDPVIDSITELAERIVEDYKESIEDMYAEIEWHQPRDGY